VVGNTSRVVSSGRCTERLGHNSFYEIIILFKASFQLYNFSVKASLDFIQEAIG
jgi:hypothetical protein